MDSYHQGWKTKNSERRPSKSDGVAITLSGYNLSLDLDQWLLASIQS